MFKKYRDRSINTATIYNGYTGSYITGPTYCEVCNGQTGLTETVKVISTNRLPSYMDLLRVFGNTTLTRTWTKKLFIS